MTHDELSTLLARKEDIDRAGAQASGPYDRWIADALAVLLKTLEGKAVAVETPATPAKTWPKP